MPFPIGEQFSKFFSHSCFQLTGEQHTLSDLLREFVPEVFSSSGGVVDTEWRVVIQGVEPALETPVHWLSEHMSHPDNFLYIVIARAA